MYLGESIRFARTLPMCVVGCEAQMQMLRIRDQDNRPVSVANILVTVEEEAAVGCPPMLFLSHCARSANFPGVFLWRGTSAQLPPAGCSDSAVLVHLASRHVVCRRCINKSLWAARNISQRKLQVLQELCCQLQG